MNLKQTLALAFIVGLCLLCNNCRYDNSFVPSSNIILNDKPLYVIRANIQGYWKLLYAQGGISGGTFPDKNHQYMIINGDVVTWGSDQGTTLDTIVWKRNSYLNPQYTFIMTYRHSGASKIVDRIKNDTLVLIDDAIDGFTAYYLRSKQP